MTDQQTAADNALLEKLVAKQVISSERYAMGVDDEGCATFSEPRETMTYRNPDGPEAAERIKSLQAELATAKGAHEMSALTVIKLSAEVAEHDRAEADRQRMRDALAHIKDADPGPTSDQSLAHDMARVAAQTLNPASKEANDEPEL